MSAFENDDAVLLEKVAATRRERSRAGLDGLVGDLDCVILNVARDRLEAAAGELLARTGLTFREAFEAPEARTLVLAGAGGADFLVACRLTGDNPFAAVNRGAKTANNLDPRLETFVFACPDLARYVEIQKGRGVAFLTPEIVRAGAYDFIQTAPSPYTGNSLGFIEWKGERGDFTPRDGRRLPLSLAKPNLAYLKNIRELDHVAVRVRAEDRDAAILEFMELTNYDFQFAVYVKSLNSITNVARLVGGDYAQVFTSGISSFTSLEDSGPTERFIHNYGVRAHHMAFTAVNIEETVDGLRRDGMDFLSDLVGSREEGLKQIFSAPSANTLLVNEYLLRFDGFDGFFTKSNVTALTKATEKQ